MADASDLHDEDLWRGGFYELAIELGERDDRRLDQALDIVWRAAEVDGCLGVATFRPRTYVDAASTLAELQRYGQLAGVTRLPRGRAVVCGISAVREDSGTDWLGFFVPVGALELAEPRSAAFPFRGGDSLLWRRPLDKWFATIGRELYAVVPFRLGLIGHEVSGLTAADELRGQPPAERWVGYLVPDGTGLTYHHANR